MNRNIETENPRVSAGEAIQSKNIAGVGDSSKWKLYLPWVCTGEVQLDFTDPDQLRTRVTIPRGSLLYARHKGKSLRPTRKDREWLRRDHKRRSQGQRPRMPPRIAHGLWVILTRDLGFGVNAANAICRLSLTDFQRLEEAIEGVVDALTCADPKIFQDGPDRDTVKSLCRKILTAGAFNRPQVVKYWKEWTNWLKHTCAGTVLIGGSPELSTGNYFRVLNSLGCIRSLLDRRGSRYNREDLARIGHLTSTRQMPYMGRQVEAESLQEFAEVIQSEPPDWTPYRSEIVDAVKSVARKCKRARGSIPINDATAHISVTSSGEWDGPQSKGGQAYTVANRMRSGLTVVLPPGDEETPFGVVHHPGDMELWKYLFRDGYRFDKDFLADKQFLAEWDGGRIPHTVEGYFYGLDGAIGKQLMYLAWRDALESGYPDSYPEIRASTVAETGNKARIVTVSHWWLNILEAPLAHWLIELLRFHESCFSAFQRQDQAWSFATMCRPPRREKLIGGESAYPCLSSDLKNATNAIPLPLMKMMWEVFITEYGYEISPYTEFVLSLISPRAVKFPDGHYVTATRGLPMGEALAKPSLTLWALVAEELAYKRFMRTYELPQIFKHRTPEGVRDELRAIRMSEDEIRPHLAAHHPRSWHFFHLGGDDHVAYGPPEYLDGITVAFTQLGAMLSPGKHGYAYTFVQYCERILDVHRTDDVRIIDTMKVRLLSTGQSTGITRDQKNVAIGKAAQFSRYLAWAEAQDGWSMTKKVILQALWMARMKAFLPTRGTEDWYAVLLPQGVGGYGLGFPRQHEEALRLCNPIFTQLVNVLLSSPTGEEVEFLLRRFGSMVRNPTSRGIAVVAKLEDEIKESINTYPSQYDAITWSQLREDPRFKDDDNKRVVARAAALGIISSSEYAKRVTRGSMFRELIMRPENTSPFQTNPYTDSIRNLTREIWSSDRPEMVTLRYTPPAPNWEAGTLNLERVLSSIQPHYFIDSTAPMTFITGPRIKIDGEWIPTDWTFEEFPRAIPQKESGRPDLVLGLDFLGLNR